MNARAILLFACLAGFVLRAIGIQYGLPHVYNPDEVAIMARALSFAKGTLNPHNFLYPTFYFYVLFAWIGLYLALVWISGRVRSVAELQLLYFSDPAGLYTAGRLLGVVAGTLTIAAVYRLAQRVADSRVASAAAIFLAVAPLAVRDSHYIKHDVPATLLIVLAYVAMLRLLGQGDRHPLRETRKDACPLATAAAACGVAFSTHYYCIFLAVPLLAVVIMRSHRDGLRVVVRNCLIATAISVAVFFLLSPFILLEPITALRDVAANRQIVVDRAVSGGSFSPALRYADMLLRDTAGIPAVLLSIVGVVAMLRSRTALACLLLSFPVLFLVFISNTVPATRYLNPIVPFIALFAAYGVSAVAASLPNRSIAFWLMTLAAAAPALYQSVSTDLFIRRTDTRTIALERIDTAIPSGATIALQPYSAPLAPTRESLTRALDRNLGSGAAVPTKFRLQLSQDPWPSPAYNLVFLGRGLDAEKIYVDYAELGGASGLDALRRQRVAYVVVKRYNRPDPETLPFLAALTREGRKLATVSPYRPDIPESPGPHGASWTAIEPFLHNTDARIDPALERPGPVLEIWQIDGPAS